MTNLRNFFNSVSGNNRIFTSEDIGEMSPEEFSSNEQAIRNQWGEIGIPSNGELFGSDDVVYVHAYTRGDGTEVRAHYRSKGGGRIGIGTVTGGVSGMGNSVAPDQPTIEEMEKERERMEKESLKILLEPSSNSTEGSDINQAITDITDIFNILGGFIPDGLMGNVGNFLSDYRENLNNMLRQNGVLTGGAAGVGDNLQVNENKTNQSTDFSLGVNSLNPYINLNNYLNKNYPQAAEMANISIVHPGNAPSSSEFTYVPPGTANILNERYNFQKGNNKRIPSNWSGIFYKKDSQISHAISNSSEFREQIKAQFNNVTGKFENNVIDIHFKNDANLFRSLANATVLDPKVDKDGYFTCKVFDKYDFSPLFKSYKDSPIVTSANNFFWYKQLTNEFHKYYVIIPVKFKW